MKDLRLKILYLIAVFVQSALRLFSERLVQLCNQVVGLWLVNLTV